MIVTTKDRTEASVEQLKKDVASECKSLRLCRGSHRQGGLGKNAYSSLAVAGPQACLRAILHRRDAGDLDCRLHCWDSVSERDWLSIAGELPEWRPETIGSAVAFERLMESVVNDATRPRARLRGKASLDRPRAAGWRRLTSAYRRCPVQRKAGRMDLLRPLGPRA
jgi:hypothetical protein